MTFKHTKYTEEIFRFFEEELDNGFIVAVAGAGKSTSLIEMLKYFNANPYKFPPHIRRGLFLFVAFSKAIKEELSGLIPQGLKREWERRVHRPIDNLAAYAEMEDITGASLYAPTHTIDEVTQAVYYWQTRYPSGSCDEANMLEEMLLCIDDGEWEILSELSVRFMKFLPDIDVKTFHGLGYMILSDHFSKAEITIRLDENKYSSLSREALKNSEKSYSKDDYQLVYRTLNKLQGLCRLNFTDVNDPKEVRDVAINYDVDIGQKYPRLMVDVIKLVPEVVNRGVNIASHSGEVDYTDMIYLPIKWDLNPDHPYDFIFVDEAQDLSSITRALTYEKSLVDKGRAFFVGDPKQCQPAGTIVKVFNGRGKPSVEKPIEELEVGDKVVSYDRKNAYYVRGALVSDVEKRFYNGPLYTVSAKGKETRCTNNHKWLVRWNHNADENTWITYLMEKDGHYRVGQTHIFVNSRNQGYRNSLDFGLNARVNSEKATKAWILNIHKSYEDAKIDEEFISSYYGIPQLTFQTTNGSRMKQHHIDKLYQKLYDASGDMKNRAEKCLSDHGRFMDYPIINKVESQTTRGGSSYFVVEACNLISDYMEIPVPKDDIPLTYKESFKDDWDTISVSFKEWQGEVYSLNVDKYELYIADGLVTHNSIMQFAGSEIDSVNLTILHTNAKELPLNVCYRCPKSHLELAKRLVPQIEPRDNAPDGTLLCASPEQLPSLVRGDDMVLCRYNAPLIAMATLLLSMGIPARVKGKDIHSSIVNTVRQIEIDITKKNGYFDFDNLEEYVNEWAKERVEYLMGMDANEGVIGNVYDTKDSILAAYNGMTAENLNQFVLGINTLFGTDQKSVMFTTVHGAKGLGRDRVFILNPSAMPSDRIGQSAWQYQQELNILYVALTRSKDFLCILGSEDVWEDLLGRIHPTDNINNYLLGGQRVIPKSTDKDFKKNLYGSPLHNPMPALLSESLVVEEELDEFQYEIIEMNDGTKLRINLLTGESEVID